MKERAINGVIENGEGSGLSGTFAVNYISEYGLLPMDTQTNSDLKTHQVNRVRHAHRAETIHRELSSYPHTPSAEASICWLRMR